MTPERLQEIIRAHWLDVIDTPDGSYAESLDLRAQRAELLGYIDVLHEDLRPTRAERDTEKKKRAQQSKDHTAEILAWDALAEDGRVKAWDEGYMRGQYPFHKVGQDDPIPPNRFPPSSGSNANPYRKGNK